MALRLIKHDGASVLIAATDAYEYRFHDADLSLYWGMRLDVAELATPEQAAIAVARELDLLLASHYARAKGYPAIGTTVAFGGVSGMLTGIDSTPPGVKVCIEGVEGWVPWADCTFADGGTGETFKGNLTWP